MSVRPFTEKQTTVLYIHCTPREMVALQALPEELDVSAHIFWKEMLLESCTEPGLLEMMRALGKFKFRQPPRTKKEKSTRCPFCDKDMPLSVMATHLQTYHGEDIIETKSVRKAKFQNMLESAPKVS